MPNALPRARVEAITDDDVVAVADFLHDRLNPRVSPRQWTSAMRLAWSRDAPNHGFLLRAEGTIVGVQLAFYSERLVGPSTERFCNLGAFCVIQGYRLQSLRLLNAALSQRGYHFTDFSPSGPVVPLNRRLGFKDVDTATALVPTLLWAFVVGRASAVTGRDRIERALTGPELAIFQDHRGAPAARHIMLREGADTCYVIFRKDRRKGLPLFASLVFVSNPGLLMRNLGPLARLLLLRHGVPLLLAELRLLGGPPPFSLRLSQPRPKMYRSSTLSPDQIDYLYSEMVAVSW